MSGILKNVGYKTPFITDVTNCYWTLTEKLEQSIENEMTENHPRHFSRRQHQKWRRIKLETPPQPGKPHSHRQEAEVDNGMNTRSNNFSKTILRSTTLGSIRKKKKQIKWDDSVTEWLGSSFAETQILARNQDI